MITYGLDLGAGSIKGLLLEEGSKILAYNIDYTTTTGFSRYLYPERDLQLSDITANARGAILLYPNTTTILDIGTQSTRAINISDEGKVKKFKFTEKCAAGAGRFVERCSKYLQIPLTDLGRIAMESKDPQVISSVCAVLAETEIINLVATEKEISDIVMGVFLSIADRATTLLKRVLTLVGGLVHNKGIIEALNKRTGLQINFSPMGHYTGALGAAILGYKRLQQLKEIS
ncbi:MAG: acyl-CoA dehydratase activase [Candidatus Hodarchaeales archaeon]|jgi:predicted CoA-substrate-specific enzyme activase